MINDVIYLVHERKGEKKQNIFTISFSLPLWLSSFHLLICDYQVAALQSEIDHSSDMYKLPRMICLSGQIAGVSRQELHLQKCSSLNVFCYQAQTHAAHCLCYTHYQLEDFY